MREESDVFLFPSLHDEGGWVIAEALAARLPVVCLDRGGPPTIGGTGVVPTRVSNTVKDLAQAVRIAGEGTTSEFPYIDSTTIRLGSILRSRFPALDIREIETPPRG
jgi:glycosyltransferase involved in cell wall biosynthesis